MRALPTLVLPWLIVACVSGFGPNEPAHVAPRHGAGAPSCLVDFDSMQAVVARDYAGYAAKASSAEAAFTALTNSVRVEVAEATDGEACTAVLQRWIDWFGDPHLQVWAPRLRSAESGSDPSRDASSRDRRRPSLAFIGNGTALLRLGSFDQRYKPAVDSLIANHRARLLSTPYLVIDVRRNGGGWTGAYESVIPLLYTDPIFVHGMEAWASEGNIAYMRSLLEADGIAEAIKRQIRALLPRMEANPGEFVVISEDREIRLDTVYPMPRAVAVLIGRWCASSCEQFVLDARQSRKVTVIGADNTGGFLDYGNVRRVELPSGRRRLQVPTARSRRLPEMPLDRIGIAPEVRLPDGETDPVAFARRFLRSLEDGRR